MLQNAYLDVKICVDTDENEARKECGNPIAVKSLKVDDRDKRHQLVPSTYASPLPGEFLNAPACSQDKVDLRDLSVGSNQSDQSHFPK